MPAYSPKNSEANLVAIEQPISAVVFTTSGNTSLGTGWSQVKTAKFQIVAASVTGTTPSFTFKLQDSADGTNWVDVPSAAFTAITAAGTQAIVVNATLLNDNLRVNLVATGTTPSATVTLWATSVAHSNNPI